MIRATAAVAFGGLYAAAYAPAHAEPIASPPASEQAKVEQARTLFEQGQIAYREGRLKDARDRLELAYQLAPSQELAFDLGRICERMGDSDAAIAHFRAYLGALGNSAERANVQARINRLQAQQGVQLRDVAPTDAALSAEARRWFERGRTLFQRGAYPAALAAFSAAQRYAAAPEFDYNLGLTSERMGRTGDAVEYYSAYVRKTKDARDIAIVQARIAELSTRTVTDRSHPPAAP